MTRLPPLTPSVATMPEHLDLHTRDTAPWDAATLLNGAVVVEWTSLAVLDGESKSNPGGGEGRHAGVHTRALVKGKAEHGGGVASKSGRKSGVVREKRCKSCLEVPAFAVSGESEDRKKENERAGRTQRLIRSHHRGVPRGTGTRSEQS